MRFAVAKIGTFRYAEHSEFESTCCLGIRTLLWGGFVPRIVGLEPRRIVFMARVRGSLCCSLADPSNPCGFGHAHAARKHPQLGLGAAGHTYDWRGIGLDLVGLSLLPTGHAARDVLARWRPATWNFYVHWNVVVCRGLDRCCFVAALAFFAHVSAFCEAAMRRRVRGGLAGIGGTGIAHLVRDLADGR